MAEPVYRAAADVALAISNSDANTNADSNSKSNCDADTYPYRDSKRSKPSDTG